MRPATTPGRARAPGGERHGAGAAEAEQAAGGRSLTDVEAPVVEGDATRAIVATAEARGADLIVLGSVSHKVVNSAPCSRLIVR